MGAVSSPGPYSIGSNMWPGLSKLIEESGEVQQVVGKLIATGGKTKHWDFPDLRECLQEEIADLMAACLFVIEANGLDENVMRDRSRVKLALFHRWHVEQADSVPPPNGGSAAERTTDGLINNCALANGDPRSACQICQGECLDKVNFP